MNRILESLFPFMLWFLSGALLTMCMVHVFMDCRDADIAPFKVQARCDEVRLLGIEYVEWSQKIDDPVTKQLLDAIGNTHQKSAEYICNPTR